MRRGKIQRRRLSKERMSTCKTRQSWKKRAKFEKNPFFFWLNSTPLHGYNSLSQQTGHHHYHHHHHHHYYYYAVFLTGVKTNNNSVTQKQKSGIVGSVIFYHFFSQQQLNRAGRFVIDGLYGTVTIIIIIVIIIIII